MPTYPLANTRAAVPVDGIGKPYLAKNRVDFSTVNGGNGAVQNDIVEALRIPANTLVLKAFAKVITPEADATDMDLGVTGDVVDGFLDGASFANAGWLYDVDEGYSAGEGKLFSAEDTIDFKVTGNHTVNAAVVEVFAVCIDLN